MEARYLTSAFDRTYEGLKHPVLGHPDEPKQAFDRTYEGLKQRLRGCPGGRGGPFDRTYEGLKHWAPHLAADGVEPLLTVPMRV